MDLRELCQTLETELSKLFEELRSGIAAREDSRAFGAMIEAVSLRIGTRFVHSVDFFP